MSGGTLFRSSIYSSNFNVYYTQWENKPSNGGVTVLVDDIAYRANINGMNALHKGAEFDVAIKLTKKNLRSISFIWKLEMGII